MEMWNHYEEEVKQLLGWIMSEADSFSKDVTTYGDKGVVDHMETCEVGWALNGVIQHVGWALNGGIRSEPHLHYRRYDA